MLLLDPLFINNDDSDNTEDQSDEYSSDSSCADSDFEEDKLIAPAPGVLWSLARHPMKTTQQLFQTAVVTTVQDPLFQASADPFTTSEKNKPR